MEIQRKNINKHEWVHKQIELLQIEKNAEIESSKTQCEGQSLREQESKGIVLKNLVISEQSTGLFGHPTVKLSSRLVPGKAPDLPSHTFSSGDIIGIYEHKQVTASCHIASAVVIRTNNTHITVALDADDNQLTDRNDGALLYIRKLANDVTYRRIKKSLQKLESYERDPALHLVGVLFDEEPPYTPLPFVPSSLCSNGRLKLFNESLDESQTCAVEFAMRQKDLAVIHGPPGTGKTTTLIEIILQHVKLGNKVLAVAPSNLAVDNLLERLSGTGTKVVRMGHPARATPKAQLRSLDALVAASDESALVKDVRTDIKDCVTKLGRTRDKKQRAKLTASIKIFRKELRERETRLALQILKQCDVTLATLTSSGDDGPLRHLHENYFDITVIDECSQGLEASCYMSVLKSPKLLLAGDHRQLPPTVFSPEGASEGLLVSLMERAVDMYGDQVTQMLKVQYRMNNNIMSWASAALYDNELRAHESVSSHLLSQLPGVDSNEDTEKSLVLIDTCGCNFDEVTGEELSKGNEGEAAVVTSYVKNLLQAGVKPQDVAVITPYNLQVEFIRNLLHKDCSGVEVRSVDGFQGREKEAVVLSLVRSNKEGEIGFLGEDRRLNVAVTRARRHLSVVCDTGTVCRHQFIKGLIDHMTDNGDVRNAMEYVRDETYIPPSVNQPSCQVSQAKLGTGDKIVAGKSQEQIDAENAKRREKLSEKISKFVSSDELTIQFEPSLNSFERRLVHEIAEEFGLLHHSTGKAKDRCIVVKKPSLREENNPELVAEEDVGRFSLPPILDNLPESDVITKEIKERLTLAEEPKDSDGEKEGENFPAKSRLPKNSKNLQNAAPTLIKSNGLESKRVGKNKKKDKAKQSTNKKEASSPETKRCTICQLDILLPNVLMHSLQCEKKVKDARLQEEVSKTKARNESILKKAASGTKTKDEHFHAVVDAFQKDNKTCSFPRCKNKSVLLLQVCLFCRSTFCLNHHQAEVHGCGEQARSAARRNIPKQVRNGVILPGSGIPSKKSSEAKRNDLKKKLNEKIDNEAGRRQKSKK